GVAWLNPDNAGFVREHWPFPSPGAYPSLPWAAAQVMGANLSPTPQPRWLRYYDTSRSWTRLSYQYALSQPPGYYKDRIVFVGLWPSTPMPNGEDDEFCTPFTRWTKESSGGVEILLTEFFNLWRGESLERPGAPVEAGVLILAGLVLGTGFCRLRGPWSLVTGAGIFLGLFLAAVLLTTYTNYWFPWLLIAGAQLPAAMAGGWAVQRWLVPAPAAAPVKGAVPVKTAVLEPVLTVPGLTLIHPPFGQGAYGKVWLGRTPAGEWRAVKAVYRARFGEAAEPYDREYSGVKKFQPLSGKHPGFLRVEQVSEKRADYFYYVMELGDALDPGWEAQPTAYKPQDLTSVCARQPNGRLPLATVREMGIALCEALAFLHDAGMTHRDIKPSNIILAGGRPKLADVGLLTDLREETQERSIVGTPGFMPPEQPGTVRADLYALGMVLYVIATGQSPMKFPDLPTLLMEGEDTGDQLQLNQIVLKACQPNPLHRYADMRELAEELKRL
ncbi:MAG TPA: protein kinase, partial [Verrucomicrobiae bacterium]